MRPSSSASSCVVKRMALAMVWRWMKVARCGSSSSLPPCAGRHLDEIAEDAVVPDLQRLDVGLVDEPRLQRRDHGARFGRERALGIELARRSPLRRSRHRGRAAAARRRWRASKFVRQRLRRSARVSRRSRSSSAGSSVDARQMRRPRSPAAATAAPMARRSRGPPRSSARRVSARVRSGTDLSVGRAAASVSDGVGAERLDRIEPRIDRARHRAAARRGAGPAGASRRA